MRTAWQLISHRSSDTSHAGRMEKFYAQQAVDYDSFRDRLLGGRRELIAELSSHLPPDPVIIELGAGTGRNTEYFAEQGIAWRGLHLVDLSDALLAQAQRRVREKHWPNVHIHRTDAITFSLADGAGADVVLFSYSLTMIPNWFSAIDNALSLLRPAGIIAVADFYVPRRFPEHGEPPRSLLSRLFWQGWFSHTNVALSGDHVPYLASRTEAISCMFSTHPLPYLPVLRPPIYRFLGRKRARPL